MIQSSPHRHPFCGNHQHCRQYKVWTPCPLMTTTTRAHTVPTAPYPNVVRPTSWLETSILVLRASRRPLSAHQIVAAALATGSTPPSRTRTPARSVNRDLNVAARRGDRVIAGPRPGQFYADPALYAQPAPSRTQRKQPPRLPIQPLALLIAAHGGLRACGIRHQPGDLTDRTRWVARLQRAYERARQSGWISLHAADQLAIHALLRHPAEVWGALWWDAE